MAYIIGTKYIETNWKNWVQGMTTSNSTEDGGFAPGYRDTNQVSCINPLITPGVLNFPPAYVDKSTGLNGSIIASCEDINGTYGKLFVSTDAAAHGEFYTATTAGVLTSQGTDNTVHFIQGKTDIISFDSEVYITSSTTIKRWQLPNTFDAGGTYPFTFGNSAAPHPALVYENNAFFGDGSQLLRLTSAGGTPSIILQLPLNQVIVALGIDPGSGLMLISVVDQLNLSGVLDTQAKVLYYDGFSNKARKVVLTDDMVTCFFNLGGTVFIGYGQNFGYWTGTGIQFLRRLYLDQDSNQLLYKHHITSVGNIIYMLEKSRVLAFGEIIQGQGRSWWYAYQNRPVITLINPTCLTYLAYNKLCFSFADAVPGYFLFTIDLTSSASLTGTGSSINLKNIYFPRAVIVNSIVIDYNDALPINTDIAQIDIFTEDDGVSYNLPRVNTPIANQHTFQIPYPSIETRVLQIRYSAYLNQGVNRIMVFYNDKQ